MRFATEELLKRFSEGDRRALAQVLSRVEDGETLPAPPPGKASTLVVGLAGSGGAGKSTLVNALVRYLRKQALRVAVLACDPQSPVTGGSLLGDRVRALLDPADEGVFFRSFSTRGAAGGVSPAVKPATAWLKAFGFDVVLVETVGVGQDQVAVREVVDVLLLLVTPNTGDEVQWEKAGLIELADLVAVNKSDLPGAERVREQLQRSLSLGAAGPGPPVFNVTAATGEAVAELWQAIARQPQQAQGKSPT